MDRIEIALAANQGYFSGLFVTACSIAASASEDVELRYNILDGGICSTDHDYLEERVRHFHKKSSFRWIPVNEELFAKYPAWHGNKMAYARLILPEALPDVDWVVYCDVDFLWLRDIAELWRERGEGLALIGTADGAKDTLDHEEAWFAQNGYPFDREKYFCSGLCFVNLEVFRRKNLIGKCLAVMSRPGIVFPDQAALNVATWGMTKIVRRDVWQRFTYELTQAEIDRGVVIHYAGEIPWKKLERNRMIGGSFLLWHQMHARFRGISTWQSLRMFYTTWEIVRHRLPCYFWRLPGMLALLVIVGRRFRKSPSIWRMVESRTRSFKVVGARA